METKITENTPNQAESMSNRKFAAIIASPVVAPMALIAVIQFGMALAMGWMFVILTFFTAASAAAIGIVGIIGAYYNLANGVGSALIMFAVGLGGLGLVAPIFMIAKEFAKGFKLLSSELIIKGKEIKNKALSFVK